MMDADCLIKLTKATLKELICHHFMVMIPETVGSEVLINLDRFPDAKIIKNNIELKFITIYKLKSSVPKGEDAALVAYQRGKFDAICTDDKRFIKKLHLLDVPYITPSVFIAILFKKSELTHEEACQKLELLSPFVSEDEYQTIKLFLDAWREK